MCFDTTLIAHESGHVSVLLAKVILTAYDNVYSLYIFKDTSSTVFPKENDGKRAVF